MVVTEVRESGQVKDRLLFCQLVVLVVEHFDLPRLDKVHFFDAGLVGDHRLGGLVDPAVKVYDELIDEAPFALLKEVRERPLELLELESLQDQLRLHSWRHELVECELFDDQVVVVQERLVDVVLDVVVQVWLDMERLVRLFYLLDPHVQRVKFLINEVLKVVRSIEDAIDRPHQEREENKPNELKDYRE